jgi:2-polyprenyl-3-methyl-5-hydroxy-6-metoxy-1,4-benzoquinol methylase
LIAHTDRARYGFKPGRASSHGRILHLARDWPRDARILDVGTASGYIGRELRHLGFTNLVGVDRDVDCAAVARSNYHEFIVRDVEQQPLGDEIGDFDVVICADVLEHIVDPLTQLRHLARRLKPAGMAVVSLPNVANWTVRLTLLAGRFPYADRGILDRTHLRFFTRRSARQLIEKAGFAIERCDPTPLPIGLIGGGIVPAPIAQAGEALYATAARAWGNLLAYQFVFVARPFAPNRPKPR